MKTREANLEAIGRLLMNYEAGMPVSEYANKILNAVEAGTMKGKNKKRKKGC